MTRPKPIDQLNPEELRVECAEAMGWHQETEGLWNNPKQHKHGRSAPDDYPADANAALQLAHALAEKGWRPNVTITIGGEWEAMFSKVGHLMVNYSATATGPHAFALALCRAYLSVIRAGKEQQG